MESPITKQLLARKKEIIENLQRILAEYKEAEIVLPRSLPRKRKANPEAASAATKKRRKNTIIYCWCEEKGTGQMVECATGDSCHCNGWVHLACEGVRLRDIRNVHYTCTRCRAESEVRILRICVVF
jgi:hypothetical protein